MADNDKDPIRLRFAKSCLVHQPHVEILCQRDTGAGAVRVHKSAPHGGPFGTVCATSGLSCSFGSYSFSFKIDNLGDREKRVPVIVGFVPRGFTGFDGKLHKGGGWGVGSNGKVYGEMLNHETGKFENPSLKFEMGDEVTVKIDTAKLSVTYTVDNVFKKKRLGEATYKVPALGTLADDGNGSFVVPAVSVGAANQHVTFGQLVDHTPLAEFAARLTASKATIAPESEGGHDDQTGDAADALGSFLLRLLRRMGESDTIRINREIVAKQDIKVRVVLQGYHPVPLWTRTAVAGVVDVDAAARHNQGFYNHTTMEVMHSDEMLRKLKDASAAAMKHQTTRAAPSLAAVAPSAVLFGCMFNVLESQVQKLEAAMVEHVAKLSTKIDAVAATASANNAASSFDVGESPFTAGRHLSMSERDPATARVRSPSTQAAGHLPALPTGADGPAKPIGRTKSQSGESMKRATSNVNGASANRRASRISGPMPVAKPKRPVSKQAVRPTMKKRETKVVIIPDTPVTGNILLSTTRKIRKMSVEQTTLEQKGSPTDDDLSNVNRLKAKINREKAQAAKDISAVSPSSATGDTLLEMADMLVEMVQEGEVSAGNVELFTALLKLKLDWAPLLKEHELVTMAAYDGSTKLLKAMLEVPFLDLDTVELIQCSFFNQTRRIPVTEMLMEHEDVLGLNSVAEEIAEVWQEFFEDIASEERAIPREDRAGRLELLARMMGHKQLVVNMENEGSDMQTVFSRACKEGDIELLTLLVTSGRKININRVQGDTTTALIQAVRRNQVKVVKILVGMPNIDVSHVSQEGSAIFFAKTLQRHPDIIKCLEAAA
jgi:hypothetical protein